MDIKTVRVSELVAGDQVVEADGALVTVASVEKTGERRLVRFDRYGAGPSPASDWFASQHVRVLR